MAQQFGALCAPSEDPGSVVSTVVINNRLELQFQGVQHLLPASVGTACMWKRFRGEQNIWVFSGITFQILITCKRQNNDLGMRGHAYNSSSQ